MLVGLYRDNSIFRQIAAAIAVIVSIVIAGCSDERANDGRERPNIILIMADDMGFSDIGCFGSEIPTPNIDALAGEGITFTQFYNAGRCCPSRASLMTGMYSHKAGIGHMVAPLDHPSYRGYLNDRCMTIAEALKPAGYVSYITGKWHVGTEKEHWPLQRGFDRFYGSNTSQGHYFKVYEGRKLLYNNDETGTPPGWYATDAFTDSTIAFMEHHRSSREEQPFFMYVAYTAPHWPIHAKPDDIAQFRGKYAAGYDSVRSKRFERMAQLSLVDETWDYPPADDKTKVWSTVDQDMESRKMEVYAAMVHNMDRGIGRILDAVKELGIEKNTLIVFLSDNGGCAEEIHRGEPGSVIGEPESYTSIGLSWATVNNTPFRKFKSWVHEGGISTPLIVKHPALIKESRVTNTVGHIIDLLPTFLDLAGVKYPEKSNDKTLLSLDGKSLVPVLRSGKREPHDALFWEHEGKRAVRQGQWKLVSAHNSEWELYDIENDRTEMHDLAGQYPDKVASLSALYQDWAVKNGVLKWDEVKNLKRLE